MSPPPSTSTDTRPPAFAGLRARTRPSTWWPGWRDVLALLLLASSSWHLVAHDGGRNVVSLAPVLVIGALALVACWSQFRGASRTVAVLAIGWSLGPVVAFAFAGIRAGATRPVMVAALAVPVWFATRRIWQRPWGPAALGVVLAAAALRSFYLTALAWWGGGGASASQWLALSWHNQAGALTGALGVAALAVALVTGGRVRAAAGVVAATSLAGAWLSGSRGALVCVAVAVLLVLVVAAREVGGRRLAAGAVLVAVATAAVTLVLTGVDDGGPAQGIAARDQSAAGNLAARFGHWEAAVAMFGDEPLTGHGPGSYRWASAERYPEDTNLTSSPHNEYLGVLAEQGLVGAVPVWVAVLGVAWLALATAWRPADAGPALPGAARSRTGVVRSAGRTAAAGMVTVLGLHAGLDFDWSYPVLLALASGAGAVLHVERQAARGRPPVAPLAGMAALTAAMVLSVTGLALAWPAVTGTSEPWALERHLDDAVSAADEGDVASARTSLALAERWNPDAWSLKPVTALVDFMAGDLDAVGLRVSVQGPRGASHADHTLVASRLVEAGEADLARSVLADLRVLLDRRQAWGVRGRVVEVTVLELRAAAIAGGCPAVAEAWAEQRAWVADHGVEAEQVGEQWTAAGSGCEVSGLPGG